MTDDPAQKIKAVIQQIRDSLGPQGWAAKLGTGGTWTITAPGGTVRVTDGSNPGIATSALTRLAGLGLDRALTRAGIQAAPAKKKVKPPRPSSAPLKAPDELAPKGKTPPVYPGEPSPDDGPVRRLISLTPKLAQELLDRPWHAVTTAGIELRQRDTDPGGVQTFADLIMRDKFRTTYQGCGIGINGSFYDGRHRASAVVATGKTVEVWMNYNVHPDDIEAYDGGRQRRTSTRLGMEGYDHPLLVGSASKLLFYYLEWEAVPEEAPPWTRWYCVRVSDPVLRDLVHQEPDLYQAVKWVAALKQPRGPGLNPSAAVVFRYLVLREWGAAEEELDSFLLAVVTGVGIDSEDHQAMFVRDWLTRTHARPVLNRRCLPEAHLVMIMSAWNRYIQGLPPQKIPGGLWAKIPQLYTP